ncbi:tRNA (adenosine(37)-N6)-threonylcarbamoyltransferase complex ATPase subunit type 1 TsaE [Paracoccus aerodenitrificans]|uniref:tRNA (adenosine(37)-N6)-threonylcarbamoyltransferase complex ATPase subunit type 1 TsaE n=1 Tax=Paracoccus aerodenitrificans TaxID=3017781 RepID=UPI0022F02636|nr:tRNA (adenosine(37)-N6)-threonylcarbamoyltransferase complex ATPase subunit type 1 TsaE [Paracoccus aerodenitrificans]WBU63820.1 tRNA (adenosine(37)-N6)-threonylcarbamoyltransferase complex ATPase subunit type 1 TsaE [Paracoccus aerodenitrificans]
MADALLTLGGDVSLTEALGRAIATELRAGDTILFEGPVGAGKSLLARTLIRAHLNNPSEDVPSPTFTLVQTYDADVPVWHADLYRLTDPAEIEELGLTDAMSGSITLIEWPDRMERVDDALTIRLSTLPDPEIRHIELLGDAGRWSHIVRAAQRAAFIQSADWADARVEFLAGDASARRYFRLTGEKGQAVLMDADPETLASYLAMTLWLEERGFTVPQIHAADRTLGLALIEDFGDAQLARVIDAQPMMAEPLYTRIASLLARLSSYPPAPGILALDGPEMARQVGLFAEWYPSAAGAGQEAQQAADQIGLCIEKLHARLCADMAPVTSLRDFHAENIILTPDDRLGLLDFQDAVAAHPGYDLASALHDPRRTLSEQVEQATIARFLDETGLDPHRFRPAFALLSAQRNLRIMGIFTRLCLRDGKTRYLDFMPRSWQLIQKVLALPELAELSDLVSRQPAPSTEIIERIRSQCPCP